ncbi:MAG: hypothetical protein HUK28_07025 [Methanobrevibacter sp.]|nr:hypothetical protein [Methanobrevibacter sp.]
MKFCVSTCKLSSLNSKDNNISHNEVILTTSTFGFKEEDDCEMYKGFLKKADKLRTKVKNGDFSDFEEF